MKLATHNSLTYLEPKCWLAKLFKFCYQCQDRSIEQQLNDGVRYFDFRISFDKLRHLEVRHGLVTFNCDYTKFSEILRMMNRKRNVNIRMVLERNVKETDETDFKIICKYIEDTFKNIRFCCGEDVRTKNTIYKFKNAYGPEVIEKYSSVSGKKLNGLYPKRWAKKNNKNMIETYADSDKFLMLDFYEIR